MNFSGIFEAIGAMVSWGFGDFTIERSTMKVGAMASLFYITGLAGIVLFPYARPYFGAIFLDHANLALLLVAGLATFGGATLQFVAFEKGKLSIIEPIMGLELPMTIALAVAFGGENLSMLQVLLTAVFFIGLILAITRHHLQLHYHKRMFEHGVILSFGAAILYGLENFTVGHGSQVIAPLATLWFVSAFTALLCLVFFIFFPRPNMMRQLKRHWKLVLAITIGESYIILTVLLGLFANHDKVKRHQIIGVAMGCAAVIALSYLHPG